MVELPVKVIESWEIHYQPDFNNWKTNWLLTNGSKWPWTTAQWLATVKLLVAAALGRRSWAVKIILSVGLGRSLSTLGFFVVDWHLDFVVNGNVESQIPVGHGTNLVARANLNDRGGGQIDIHLKVVNNIKFNILNLQLWLVSLLC